MRAEQFQNLIHPETGEPLYLVDSKISDQNVEIGRLTDARGRMEFEIRGFIPRFVDGLNYAENFGLQWRVHSKTQLDSYNGATYSADRFFETTGWPRNMNGEKILEAGSGAGRFTEVLAQTGAEIFTFDYSDAVVANYENNSRFSNVCFFQVDIYRMPFPRRFFDRVVCLGVLQHTPDVQRSFGCLAQMVKPGGYMAVDIYQRVWRHMLHWKYVLRPITTRMPADDLYKFVRWYALKLIPVAKVMRNICGKAGHRLVPILDQSDKAVPPHVQRDWTILDTYDALAAAYDQPQTDETMLRWFADHGFMGVHFHQGRGGGQKAT